MRKAMLIAVGFVAGLLVSLGARPLWDAPRAEAQGSGLSAKWEHKAVVFTDPTDGKALKQVDDGGWEYSGLFINRPNENFVAVFKRLKK